MMKFILAAAGSTLCLGAPALAQSYIPGDGCDAPSTERQGDGLVGHLSGGTRYHCSRYMQRQRAAATPTYTAPATTSYTSSSSSQTYVTQSPRVYSQPSYSTQTYTKPATTTYSSGTTRGYTTTQPSTTYLKGGTTSGYTTTRPATTTQRYAPGTKAYRAPATTTYSAPARSSVTVAPRSTTTYQSAPRTSYQTYPTTSYSAPKQTHNRKGWGHGHHRANDRDRPYHAFHAGEPWKKFGPIGHRHWLKKQFLKEAVGILN